MTVPFDQKYEPQAISDFLFPTDEVKEEIGLYTNHGFHENLFLYGPPGSGKTLLGKLLPRAIFGANYRNDAVTYLNAMTEKDRNSQIDSFYNNYRRGLLPGPQVPCRIIVVNEIGDMKKQEVEKLKNILDKITTADPPFMLITTSNTAIASAPVASRGTNLLVPYPPTEELIAWGKNILNKEGVSMSDPDLLLLARTNPAPRNFLKSLGKCVALNGRLPLSIRSQAASYLYAA